MADPDKGNITAFKHRRTRKAKAPRPAAEGLVGRDGRALDGAPQLLLPQMHLPRNDPVLQLGHGPEGITVMIGDGMVQLVDGREITSTTIPWGAVQSFAMGLIGIIANYFPRQVDEEGGGGPDDDGDPSDG